jgi:hypothetical protein
LQGFYRAASALPKVKSERRDADIEKRWDQSMLDAQTRRVVTGSSRQGHRREVEMKVLYGKYPRLGMVALIASIALASGAAKKWC